MKATKKMLKLAEHVWKYRDVGMHGWYKYYNNYVTIECIEADGQEYIEVLLVDKIDSLGYPFGNVLDEMEFYASDFEG